MDRIIKQQSLLTALLWVMAVMGQVSYASGVRVPQVSVLNESSATDMTSSIVNPNFTDGTMKNGAPAGWTLDAAVTQSKISTAAKSDGFIAAGQNHWQLWQASSALTGRACQKITNIPNGRYTVSADIVTTNFGGSINLYANDGKTAVSSASAKRYSATGIVVDGTLEIGLSFATTGGLTIDYDSFTLEYQGEDAQGYRDVLSQRITSARQTLSGIDSGYDTTALSKALAEAEALTEGSSSDEVIAAIAAIDQATADYQNYLAAREAELKNIEQFSALVDGAKSERQSESYPDSAAMDKAIARAESFLAELQANPSLPIDAASDSLGQARENYYNSQYSIAAESQTVSYVDLSLSGSEKYVLRIDDRPYYPVEIQVRPDKMRGYIGWSEDEIEATFKRAADDGFATLSVPVYWKEVEPEKNHFDWHILDKYLSWCKKYGVKMELLWFSWSSGGRVQYLWNYGGRQEVRTPDYVCSLDGKSDYNMLRTEWEYSLDWRDTNLRDRETYVLSRVMNHVALWDANNGNPHTVIGVQLGNEARSHGANTATAAEIIDYYHHVGAAVKQSKYVVWTRLNCVSGETWGRTNANESKRNNGGTNIDYVGVDIYGTNADRVKGNLDGNLGENGRNYRMIMEIDAKDSSSPIYQLAALAGDKAFDYYNLGPVDGNGLYGNNGHTLSERSHISLVRQRNKILGLANQDIALRKQGSGLYVYNYAGNSTSAETGLSGISFTPDKTNTQAIAVRHSGSQIALLSTLGGTFSLPVSLNATSAQKGYFDAGNRWVSEGSVTINNNKVEMPETSCVLVTLDGHENDNNAFVVNGEFNDGTIGWTNTTNAYTYKVSTLAKGDGTVITADGGHLQLWSGSAITGNVYQRVNLPDGAYTLKAGCYASFGGSVYMYAGDSRVAIVSGKNAYYQIPVEVTGGTLEIGLNVATNGETDIEWDHVVLQPREVLTAITRNHIGKVMNPVACYTIDGRRAGSSAHGLIIQRYSDGTVRKTAK